MPPVHAAEQPIKLKYSNFLPPTHPLSTQGQQFCIPTAQAITGLPRYMFFCRTFGENGPTAKRIVGYPNIERRGDEANPTKLIKASLQRYGIRRKDVMEKINRFLAS